VASLVVDRLDVHPGFFNWLAFVYIGIRARHAAWTLAGFAYLMPLILTAAAFGTPLFRGFAVLQLFVSAASWPTRSTCGPTTVR